MPSVEITILGETYSLKGADLSETQIEHLSSTINSRLNEVIAAYPGIPKQKTLIVALFNLGREFSELKTEHDMLLRQIKEKTDILTDALK